MLVSTTDAIYERHWSLRLNSDCHKWVNRKDVLFHRYPVINVSFRFLKIFLSVFIILIFYNILSFINSFWFFWEI